MSRGVSECCTDGGKLEGRDYLSANVWHSFDFFLFKGIEKAMAAVPAILLPPCL